KAIKRKPYTADIDRSEKNRWRRSYQIL
ncbi:hypothetical protein EE612_053294, partial [Oryza sativa]